MEGGLAIKEKGVQGKAVMVLDVKIKSTNFYKYPHVYSCAVSNRRRSGAF